MHASDDVFSLANRHTGGAHYKGHNPKQSNLKGYKPRGNQQTNAVTKVDPVARKNEHNLYIKNIAEIRVALPPHKVVSNQTSDNVLRVIANQLEGRCNVDGYVQPGSIHIVTHSPGQIRGSVIEFNVVIEYNACNPAIGTLFINACKCISVTKAGIRAELADMHGNVPVDIFVHRDLFPTNLEFNEIKVGDRFSVCTIGNRFELNDPRISIMCQVYTGAGSDTTNVGINTDLQSILERNRVDLQSLKQMLYIEQAAVDKTRRNEPYLIAYKLASDDVSYITRAIQEIPILNAKITSKNRKTGKTTLKLSFIEAWNKYPEMREEIHASSDVREAKWDLGNKYGYQIVTTFMPGYAKQIYQHFKAKRVLDPCGGWGDRLLGALAVGKNTGDFDPDAPPGGIIEKYVCFDPNPNVRDGYAEIVGLYNIPIDTEVTTEKYMRFKNGFEVYTDRFEVGAVKLKSESFDLVFTSPPFFDFEVYDPSNPTYTNWYTEFYMPLFEQAYRCLVKGGHICIHIDDTSAGSITPFLQETKTPGQKEPHFKDAVPDLEFVGRIAVIGIMSDKPRSIWTYHKPE